MKRVFLVRHAKSSWSYPSLPDIDRPLNERGYRDAHAMGSYLFRQKIRPGIFLSSPAIRALSTALIFSRAGLFDQGRIQIIPQLYETSPDEYLETIRSQDDHHNELFLFAHNPDISRVYNLLGSTHEEEMSTCNIGIVEFSGSNWNEITFGSGLCKGLLKPSRESAV